MQKLVPFLLTIAFVTVVPLTAAQGGEDAREDVLARDGSPITFYGHILAYGRGSPLPMNTQFPENAEDYSLGTAGGCGTPPPLPDGTYESTGEYTDCPDWTPNESWWYTTAGFVQVKDWQEWGGDYSKFHNERGQTKDIYLDTSETANFTFYMSADFHGWPVLLCDVGAPCWNWDPGTFDDWVIESWIWHASLGEWSQSPSDRPDVGTVADCFESMAWTECEGVTLVAHGKTDPTVMASFDPTLPVVGDETVQEFQADFEWDPGFAQAGGVVPFENDLIVQFEWYQETDGQKYIRQTPGAGIVWNLNGGEDYPANVVLPVRNPLDVELVFPRFVHDKLVVLSIINTPWGSYDIDPSMTSMTVRDASGTVVDIDPSTLEAAVDASVAHAGHYKPINATWVWDYQQQDLPPGEYTVTVEATNFQHSFTTSTDAFFTISAAGEGGQATAGRSGLASYTDEDFEAFQEGAGIRDDGSDQNEDVSPSDHDDQDSPGFAVIALLAALGAVAALRRARA